MNSIFKTLSTSLIIATLPLLSACDRNAKDYSNVTVYLNSTAIPYTDNIWSDYMNETSQIISQNVVFSHKAYPSWSFWNGFIASRVNDTADYSETNNWLDNQFAAITGGGKSGTGTPYLIAYWDSSENTDISLDEASCTIKYGTHGETFIPQSLFFSNTTYTYFTMVNGSNYSKKFTTGDYLKLLVYGVKTDGTKSGPVIADLSNYTSPDSKPVNTWEYLNLDSLGEVVGIYFQMQSSDTSTYGINVPTYFAIDRLSIKLL